MCSENSDEMPRDVAAVWLSGAGEGTKGVIERGLIERGCSGEAGRTNEW